MNVIRLSLFTLFAGILVSGCATSVEDQVVGVWSVEPGATNKANEKLGELPEAAQKFLSSAVLKVRADHTYQLIVTAAQKGTWTLEQNKLQLKPEGKGIPLSIELRGDGTGLVEQETPIGSIKLVFKKTG